MNGHYHAKPDTSFTADLNIKPLLEWLCIDPRFNREIHGLLLTLCKDPVVLRYRHDVVDDLLALPDLTDHLETLLVETGAFSGSRWSGASANLRCTWIRSRRCTPF